MARIRSIKPEFPQSESMGRISRDARLTFIQCWTLADDEGRLRGNSRMLASLLFPYDDDAPGLIDEWLAELEREKCLIRYQIEGQSYMQISNWLNHQKIDKPSRSKIPPFDESSRILANPREVSSGDQGSRIKDQGEEGKGQNPAPDKPARFDPIAVSLPSAIPRDSWERWIAYRRGRKLTVREPTIDAQLRSLVQWYSKGHDPTAIIELSIANGWQGLFEPKTGGRVNGNGVAGTIAELTGANRVSGGHAGFIDGEARHVD